MINKLETPHGILQLPAFLPDATLGQVRGVDAYDLDACGIQAVMMNSYHLMQKPGKTVITALEGLHDFTSWKKPIFTDSGGFQAYSLIRQNANFGSFSKNGIVIKEKGKKNKIQLTPEKSMRIQLDMGADVLFCLDDCTHVDDKKDEQEISVSRTIKWAKRCKLEFDKLVEQRKINNPPLLFAVIQGGGYKDLRKKCAEELLNLGFDGFGFGGWPLDSDGNLLQEIVGYTRSLIPEEFPMHALGIGHPDNILKTFDLGYPLFDCAMPTRDARHGRLYRVHENRTIGEHGWLEYFYIEDDRHRRQKKPLMQHESCYTCRNFSTGYLHHLYQLNETLYTRLATIHNLSFMTDLMRMLRGR